MGIGLFVSIVMFGSVSGGNFNPAVSTGIFISNGHPKRDFPEFIGKVASQVIGAMVGFYAVWLSHF